MRNNPTFQKLSPLTPPRVRRCSNTIGTGDNAQQPPYRYSLFGECAFLVGYRCLPSFGGLRSLTTLLLFDCILFNDAIISISRLRDVLKCGMLASQEICHYLCDNMFTSSQPGSKHGECISKIACVSLDLNTSWRDMKYVTICVWTRCLHPRSQAANTVSAFPRLRAFLSTPTLVCEP